MKMWDDAAQGDFLRTCGAAWLGGCEGGVPNDETNRWKHCSTILQLTQRSVVGGIGQPYIPKAFRWGEGGKLP